MKPVFTFELVCVECDAVLCADCEFEPDIPPVPCSNPDDPRYADPGSAGGAYGYPEVCPACGTKVDPQYAYRRGADAYADWAEGMLMDAAERAWEDKYDR